MMAQISVRMTVDKREVKSFGSLLPLAQCCVVFGSQPSLLCQSIVATWSGQYWRQGCELSLKRLHDGLFGHYGLAWWPSLLQPPPPAQLFLEPSDFGFLC
jgi:hypothetical protein